MRQSSIFFLTMFRCFEVTVGSFNVNIASVTELLTCVALFLAEFWLHYLQFELTRGDPVHVGHVRQKATDALDSNLMEEFNLRCNDLY